jgi:hypothetical protein
MLAKVFVFYLNFPFIKFHWNNEIVYLLWHIFPFANYMVYHHSTPFILSTVGRNETALDLNPFITNYSHLATRQQG